MKNRSLVVLISLAAFLVGCAGIVRKENASDQVFLDLKSAALSTPAIGALGRGQSSLLKIGGAAPSLNSPDIKGKFEILSIKGEKERAFVLEVTAQCDCMGFRKWTVAPLAYLIDAQGKTVSTTETLAPTIVVLKGNFPADGTYQLVVIADSARTGSRVGTVAGGAMLPGGVFAPTLFTIPMTAQPTGTLFVAYRKDEK